jgi:hypothetical protein
MLNQYAIILGNKKRGKSEQGGGYDMKSARQIIVLSVVIGFGFVSNLDALNRENKLVHYFLLWKDEDGNQIGNSYRVTHTWVEQGGIWQIIGGMSAEIKNKQEGKYLYRARVDFGKNLTHLFSPLNNFIIKDDHIYAACEREDDTIVILKCKASLPKFESTN